MLLRFFICTFIFTVLNVSFDRKLVAMESSGNSSISWDKSDDKSDSCMSDELSISEGSYHSSGSVSDSEDDNTEIGFGSLTGQYYDASSEFKKKPLPNQQQLIQQKSSIETIINYIQVLNKENICNEIGQLKIYISEIENCLKDNSNNPKNEIIECLKNLRLLLSDSTTRFILASTKDSSLFEQKALKIFKLIERIDAIILPKEQTKFKKNIDKLNLFVNNEHIERPMKSKRSDKIGGGHFPLEEEQSKFRCISENSSGQQLGYWICQSNPNLRAHYKISTLFSTKDIKKIWEIVLQAESLDDTDRTNYVYFYEHDTGECLYFTVIRDERDDSQIVTIYPIFVVDSIQMTYENYRNDKYDISCFSEGIKNSCSQSVWFPDESTTESNQSECPAQSRIVISPSDCCEWACHDSRCTDNECIQKLLNDIKKESYCFRLKNVKTGKVDPEWTLMELRRRGLGRTYSYIAVKYPAEMFTPEYQNDKKAKAEKIVFCKKFLIMNCVAGLNLPIDAKRLIVYKYNLMSKEQIDYYKKLSWTALETMEQDL